MKATSIFGGVQVFNILISIVRSKFVAVLLGPGGMGILSLLSSTTGLIGGLTNFGLGKSAIKDVAAANSAGNQNRTSIIIIVLRRWVWLTGLLGMGITILFAPLLSKYILGNSDYTFPLIWISVSLLFTQLSTGQLVVLQGLRKLQFLAKANLTGSVLGLIFTIPLYYWLKINGIIPGIIISSVIALICSWYYSSKIKIEEVPVSINRTIAEGKSMLSMGLMLNLSSLIAIGFSYFVRIFINHLGGINQVGLYSAGFAIISSYVGVVFSAMGTDFYPRLTAVANDNNKCSEVINQQAEIAIIIISPLIISFMVFIHWIVVVLYSNKFISINDMILWAALGMMFKAVSWAIAYIFLAKGTSKLFFWNELISNIYLLALNLIGYYYFGLTGLGISFLITYILYLIQVYFIAKYKFEFSFTKGFRTIFISQFVISLLAFLIVYIIGGKFSYIVGSILLILSIYYSYRELNKRIGIKQIINKFLKSK